LPEPASSGPATSTGRTAPTAATAPTGAPRPAARPDNPWLIVGIAAAVIAVFGILGFAATPLISRLLSRTPKSSPIAGVEPGGFDANDEKSPAYVPLPQTPSELETAFRDARAAQDALESLCIAMRKTGPNDKLIGLAEKRQDFEALQSYRGTAEMLEKQMIDAETHFLLAARRLNQLPGDVRDQAFDRLEDDVSSVGVNWRMRVAALIRRHIPTIGPEQTRIDPETRDALMGLQDVR
jgi:hypothetical protein